jgi:hypothetical protein
MSVFSILRFTFIDCADARIGCLTQHRTFGVDVLGDNAMPRGVICGFATLLDWLRHTPDAGVRRLPEDDCVHH